MATKNSTWEELRRRARHLENEIDLKLVSFSKLGTNYNSQGYKKENLEEVPLLNSTSSDHMFETMALEIEQLLSKFADINDEMGRYIETQGANAATGASHHTLQRLRDILKGYLHEFQKTKSNIQAYKEREELLGSVNKDLNSYKNASGLNRRVDLYLKEHEHIRNSDRMVGEQINIAVKTKEELLNQRLAVKAIQTKMTTLANRFPMLNTLLQKINLRKRRDSIILGIVISGCIILLFIYAFH